MFSRELARTVAERITLNTEEEEGLVESFVEVCDYLSADPDNLMSWRGKNRPSLETEEGLTRIAEKYFAGFRKSDFPVVPGTIPDEIVSVVLQEAYDYTESETDLIKLDHQRAMVAENCVGNLLERYLDSKLRSNGWHWCCGSIVKAVDFVARGADRNWSALQIKNRDNSENSSSSKVRAGTQIEKWFRSFSKKQGTNWDNLPELMKGFGLSEADFQQYLREYLIEQKERLVENQTEPLLALVPEDEEDNI